MVLKFYENVSHFISQNIPVGVVTWLHSEHQSHRSIISSRGNRLLPFLHSARTACLEGP